MPLFTRLPQVARLLVMLLCAALLPAQEQARNPLLQPGLPQDSGAAGLEQILLRLKTTARMLHTTAHPDDEDGAMLTLMSRGRGASVTLLTLNRGEGGQNVLAGNLFDELGVLRTLELLASDRYYGVEQRFTRVADFGYSKNADEAFAKWKGHETALGDMVRVIRTFRPDVIVSRFQGTRRDGHGQHEAAGVLSREAFRAAADLTRFPEQLREGLEPWQARRLYVDNVRAGEEHDVALTTDTINPTLGASYFEFALQGLQHQLSQGAGSWRGSSGPHVSRYKLVDSVAPVPASGETPAEDFFAGIDTSLPGLAARLGEEESRAAFLRPALAAIAQSVDEAAEAARQDPARAATPLLAGWRLVRELIARLEQSDLSSRSTLLVHLRTKEVQFARAATLALGLEFTVEMDSASASSLIVPGQTFGLTARFENRGAATVAVDALDLNLPTGWVAKSERTGRVILAPGHSAVARFRVTAAPDAPYTRPYWHRNNPEADTLHALDREDWATVPLPPPPVSATTRFAAGSETGSLQAVATAGSGNERRPLAVVPPFSVRLEPASQVIAAGAREALEVQVAVRSQLAGPARATLRLEAPPGWRVEPPAQPATFADSGETVRLAFRVYPAELRNHHAELRAVLLSDAKEYREGFRVVAREDLGTFYYYEPAVQRLSVVEVATPGHLRVGYVMGAGDSIPDVLRQLGLSVIELTPQDVAAGDLSRFQTIVLGIRAYDTREDVRQHNARLLQYVENGGTLLVQYNTETTQFNSGQFTPYAAQISRDRVADETAPVEILAPEDPLFRFPNRITQQDFDGWVQERGLYFLNQWDGKFEPLLASGDPGEPPLQGGLLRARYGKGTYLYTSYAFFRQLPAGVPGAIRLFINLVSAGHEAR